MATVITIHQIGEHSKPVELTVTLEAVDRNKIRYNLSTEPGEWREVSRYGSAYGMSETWERYNQLLNAASQLVYASQGLP